MNKASLYEIVHNHLGGTKIQAEQTVELILDSIKKEVAKGKKVSLGGFGIFRTHKRAARVARNPKTGESVKVPAKVVVKFTSASSFKEAVN